MELDDEVCLCFHVTLRKLVRYLHVQKPGRASQLSECFGAGTGCGWCRPFLTRLFAAAASGPPRLDDVAPAEYATGREQHRCRQRETPPAPRADAALDWLDAELADLDAQALRRHPAVRTGPQTPGRITMDGRELINFSSNDYLGLAADALTEAVVRAVRQVGWGAGASPLVSGRGALHAELERALAEFEGTEAALLFPSGYAANVGTITALAGAGDVIFSDAKNHASIIDGCRLSGATIAIYAHRDVRRLQEMLAAANGFRRRLIVTDTLFSMDGDLAPLPELADLAQTHQAMLLVDEAHATGVFGAAGRGACEQLGVEGRVPIRVGTLSKALGSSGGFVVGSRRLIDWLSNRARPYGFSTAPPEAMAAAALEALRIVREQPERRTELLARAARLRERLQQQGWNTGNSCSQIIPVVLGTAECTMHLAAQLRARGFLVPGIRPPSVPAGESRLRISVSQAHSAAALERLAETLAELRP